MKKLILIIILFLAYPLSLFADNSHFIDFKKVLNTSKYKQNLKVNQKNIKKLKKILKKKKMK